MLLQNVQSYIYRAIPKYSSAQVNFRGQEDDLSTAQRPNNAYSLESRAMQLDAREQELNERAQELDKLKAKLDRRAGNIKYLENHLRTMIAAELMGLYGLTEHKVEKYESQGAKMLVTSQLVQQRFNLDQRVAHSLVKSLSDAMENKDGEISTEMLKFVERVFESATPDFKYNDVLGIIDAVKDENGNLDPDKSAYYLSMCPYKVNSRDIIAEIRKQYPNNSFYRHEGENSDIMNFDIFLNNPSRRKVYTPVHEIKDAEGIVGAINKFSSKGGARLYDAEIGPDGLVNIKSRGTNFDIADCGLDNPDLLQFIGAIEAPLIDFSNCVNIDDRSCYYVKYFGPNATREWSTKNIKDVVNLIIGGNN